MRRRRELLFQLIWWAAVAGVGWLTLRYALVWLLPFLLALGAAALLEPLIAASGRKSMGKVAIGTVKGDLHDIGKNLVAIMLKGAGYDVIDLGVNCDITKYEEGVKQGATIIGCSSLLTTTMPYMKEVVAYFKDKGVKVVIGGAPVTQAYADEIGADGYSEDANGAVKLIDSLLKTA